MQLSLSYLKHCTYYRLTPGLLLGLLVATLNACTSHSIANTYTNGTLSTGSFSRTEELISALAAEDLVFVLAQTHPPKISTLQLGPADTSFAEKLVAEIIRTGFGVQRVSADQGPFHVNYSQMSLNPTAIKSRYRFLISIGKMGFEREYAVNESNDVVPTSAMRAYGVKARIQLNPEIFLLSSASYPEKNIHTVNHINDSNMIFDPPAQSSDDLVSSPMAARVTSRQLDGAVQKTFVTSVRAETIQFNNDSIRLLNRGKLQIKRLAKFYNAETDLIELTGCSNGPTVYPGGNKKLSMDRTQRIFQAFVNQKIENIALVKENCAPVATKTIPTRGVVAVLRRSR